MGGVCIPIKVDLLLAKLEVRQIDGHNHSATWSSRKVDCMAKNRFYQCRKTNSFIVKFKHEKAFWFGIQILKTWFH